MSVDYFKTVLEELEKIHEKLDRILVSKGSDWDTKEHMEVDLKNAERIVTMPDDEFRKDFALPVTGKYQWYRFSNHEGKVRKCENEGCDLFLLWNKDKKKYEHWKYDANTGKGGYVADECEGFYNG